jgi:hypothetical protein
MNIIKHHILIHSVYKYVGRFVSVSGFREAVELAVRNRIKSEIIGQWLYCFTTHLIGVQLQAIGFWHSLKHCAYVYSGNPKENITGDETLDEIRTRLGNSPVYVKEAVNV